MEWPLDGPRFQQVATASGQGQEHFHMCSRLPAPDPRGASEAHPHPSPSSPSLRLSMSSAACRCLSSKEPLPSLGKVLSATKLPCTTQGLGEPVPLYCPLLTRRPLTEVRAALGTQRGPRARGLATPPGSELGTVSPKHRLEKVRAPLCWLLRYFQ